MTFGMKCYGLRAHAGDGVCISNNSNHLENYNKIAESELRHVQANDESGLATATYKFVETSKCMAN